MGTSGMNKVILIGNLCADPELRFTQSGTGVLNLRLACNEQRKVNDQWVDHAEFVNVVVWGKRGEGLAKILFKGNKIAIEGKLRTSTYEANDGSGKRSSTEVVAIDVVLCGGDPDRAHREPRGSSAPRNSDPGNGGGFSSGPVDDDDISF